MLPGVLGPEMHGEPGPEAGAEGRFVETGPVLVGLHEVADLVERALVVLLVDRVAVLARLAHDLLLEREVGGDAGVDLA